MWGMKPGVGRAVLARRSTFQLTLVSSRPQAQHHCLTIGSLGSDFQMYVCLVMSGILVYLVISLVPKLSPRVLHSSMKQAAGGIPLLQWEH